MRSTLKKFCCTIAFTATVVGSFIPAIPILNSAANAAPAKSGWVAVTTDSRNKTWYVDNGSIQGRGRYRYFWSYIVGGTPYPDSGKIAYSTAFYLSVDCQQKRFRLRFAKSLDENNKVIKEYDFGDKGPMGGARADSGEAASLNHVCSRR
ncbi:hypothetical protein K9N68_15965 [Kovacikia minuta CCNUW1]|uniref:surface-adhesin E family protein n=1 Tax=Kovacikia minuta TaxID=2931930 RepID=UPI001CCA7366|nr:surface-adhesin E family protein [Kovacikia minuta]UBF29195.1 hypothetical protein K9N68_15965 [Kovacikia minuta CCNUW1]